MQRVVVFGASGSGKTTLARWLAARCDLPFTDLDDVFWKPGWIESSSDEFQAAVESTAATPRWVVAGSYGTAREILWPRADTLIWLDLPLARVLFQCAWRAVRQWWTAEPICNGNRQDLAAIFYGRDSLLGYTLQTYHARRRQWPLLLAAPEHAHATKLRLRSQAQIRAWCTGVSDPTQAGNTPVDK